MRFSAKARCPFRNVAALKRKELYEIMGRKNKGDSIGMKDDRTTHLRDLVKRLRTEQGLSVYELAARSDLNRSTLMRIEAGTHAQPSARTLNHLARGLGIDPEELYDASWIGSDEPLPSPATYLRTKYGLSEDELRLLQSAVKRHQESQEPDETKGGHHDNTSDDRI